MTTTDERVLCPSMSQQLAQYLALHGVQGGLFPDGLFLGSNVDSSGGDGDATDQNDHEEEETSRSPLLDSNDWKQKQTACGICEDLMCSWMTPPHHQYHQYQYQRNNKADAQWFSFTALLGCALGLQSYFLLSRQRLALSTLALTAGVCGLCVVLLKVCTRLSL
jgi:hypothetical protein